MNENEYEELNSNPPELETIVIKFERISLTSAPSPPSLVVSEPTSKNLPEIGQTSQSQKKKSSMAVRIGRGAVGRRKGRPVANVEVLETMQQIQARLEAFEVGKPRDPKDVSEPEAEEEEGEDVELTPEMRFFKIVLGSTSKP